MPRQLASPLGQCIKVLVMVWETPLETVSQPCCFVPRSAKARQTDSTDINLGVTRHVYSLNAFSICTALDKCSSATASVAADLLSEFCGTGSVA